MAPSARVMQNRRFVAILGMVWLGTTVMWPTVWLAGLPFHISLTLLPFIYFLSAVALGIAMQRKLTWSSVPFGMAFMVAPLFPAYVWEIIGASLFTAAVLIAHHRRGHVEVA